MSPQEAYNQLAFYTLSHTSPTFIHQYVVDAFAAQTAAEADKPIRLAFALIGLYLAVEKGYTGRQVQLAHMDLANRRKDWPHFSLPEDRGNITAETVLQAQEGSQRDEKIIEWCASVWQAYAPVRTEIINLIGPYGY